MPYVLVPWDYGGTTELETNSWPLAPENEWLEDEFPFWDLNLFKRL